MRVLVIEDNEAVRNLLLHVLSNEGFSVDQAADGEDGRGKAIDPAYDLILLDLRLPKVDGLSVLRELRSQGLTTPVLVLTGKDTVSDRIHGLDCGADDYLAKPFAFDELLARMRALLRRSVRGFNPILRVGPVSLDRVGRVARWRDQRVELSACEFAILEVLMQHPGEILCRARIYEQVWNEPLDVSSNVIDVHIMEIRRKLNGAGGHDVISTVRRAGYRLEQLPE